MSIEKKAQGYRRFCLVSVLMGYETLKLLKNNYDLFKGKVLKMPKKTALDIVSKVKSDFYTNKKLEDILIKN